MNLELTVTASTAKRGMRERAKYSDKAEAAFGIGQHVLRRRRVLDKYMITVGFRRGPSAVVLCVLVSGLVQTALGQCCKLGIE